MANASGQSNDVPLDAYDALGVSVDATHDEIKRAFRKLSLQHHPDKVRDKTEEIQRRFDVIKEAYDALSEPRRRQLYDVFSVDLGEEKPEVAMWSMGKVNLLTPLGNFVLKTFVGQCLFWLLSSAFICKLMLFCWSCSVVAHVTDNDDTFTSAIGVGKGVLLGLLGFIQRLAEPRFQRLPEWIRNLANEFQAWLGDKVTSDGQRIQAFGSRGLELLRDSLKQPSRIKSALEKCGCKDMRLKLLVVGVSSTCSAFFCYWFFPVFFETGYLLFLILDVAGFEIIQMLTQKQLICACFCMLVFSWFLHGRWSWILWLELGLISIVLLALWAVCGIFDQYVSAMQVQHGEKVKKRRIKLRVARQKAQNQLFELRKREEKLKKKLEADGISIPVLPKEKSMPQANIINGPELIRQKDTAEAVRKKEEEGEGKKKKAKEDEKSFYRRMFGGAAASEPAKKQKEAAPRTSAADTSAASDKGRYANFL